MSEDIKIGEYPVVWVGGLMMITAQAKAQVIREKPGERQARSG